MNREAAKGTLRSLAHGVYALGAGSGPAAHLAAVSWAMQTSAEPPMIAVALHVESRAAAMVRDGGAFTLSPLPASARALASRLGRPAAPASKLAGVALETSPVLGLPLPTEATGWLECRVIAETASGDHVVFVGAVLEAGRRGDAPTMTLGETGWRYGA